MFEQTFKTLQTKTFYGRKKKSLAYVIGIMNMIHQAFSGKL